MTIKDLSALTGYSVGTISRVLNHQPNVSDKARAIILEAAEKSGFQLNPNAKQLKQLRTNTILVAVKGSSNQLFGSLLERIQSHIAQTPYPLAVDYMDEDCNEVRRAVQLCREKKPCGVMFLGGNRQNFLADFGKIDVPCVLVTNDASAMPYPNLSSISSDDRQGARSAIEALIRIGHRKIAVIGGNRQVSDTTRLRYAGCLDAMQAAKIPFDPERDYAGVRFSYADGYRATMELLRRGSYSAIFAMADVMAIGAIRALLDSGLRVPQDVSVVGFDGLSIGSYTTPRLSTVCQTVELLAQRSVRILTERIETGAPPCYETIPAEVQLRESVCAI